MLLFPSSPLHLHHLVLEHRMAALPLSWRMTWNGFNEVSAWISQYSASVFICSLQLAYQVSIRPNHPQFIFMLSLVSLFSVWDEGVIAGEGNTGTGHWVHQTIWSKFRVVEITNCGLDVFLLVNCFISILSWRPPQINEMFLTRIYLSHID